MPIANIPKYPVVDPNPSTGKIISNFNLTDYRNIAIAGISGYGFGWFPGLFNEILRIVEF